MTKATPHGGQESPSIPSNTATSAGRISNPCTAICPLMEFAATGKSKCKSLMVHDNTVEEDGQLGGPHGRPPRLHVLTSTSKAYATYDSSWGAFLGNFPRSDHWRLHACYDIRFIDQQPRLPGYRTV